MTDLTDLRRKKAIKRDSFYLVVTEDTKWVFTWEEFISAGGVYRFMGDQGQIEMTLPAGYKFSYNFERI